MWIYWMRRLYRDRFWKEMIHCACLVAMGFFLVKIVKAPFWQAGKDDPIHQIIYGAAWLAVVYYAYKLYDFQKGKCD